MMPFMTRSELRWSRYILFSDAICKIEYRELEHYLTITRCYVINGKLMGTVREVCAILPYWHSAYEVKEK